MWEEGLAVRVLLVAERVFTTAEPDPSAALGTRSDRWVFTLLGGRRCGCRILWRWGRLPTTSVRLGCLLRV